MTIDLRDDELLPFKWKDTQTGLTDSSRNKAISHLVWATWVFEQAGSEKFLLFHIANAVLDLDSTERRKSPVSVSSTLNLGDQLPQKK